MVDRRIAKWLLTVSVVCGCANSMSSKSSETHFLGVCAPGDCADGQSCVCGVCTVACESDAMCAGLADDVQCLDPEAADCATAAFCDVTCDDDADCAALEGDHRCQAGRCRGGPEPEPPPTGGCSYGGETFENGETVPDVDGCNSCRCASGEVACTDKDCVLLRDCAYNDAIYRDGETFPAGDDCNQCMCNDGSVECSPGDCATVIDEPPCARGSCEIYGICYPAGVTTEDGCCSCDGCIEPAWCPGRPDIGSRCGTQTMGCAMGLECRTDLFGERPMCTRSCNYGCPSGTECVEQVPAYDGSVVYRVCLRTCTTQADCEFSEGSGAASECDTLPGLDKSYCF